MACTPLRLLIFIVLAGAYAPAFPLDVQAPGMEGGENASCGSGMAFKTFSLTEALVLAMAQQPQMLIAQLELQKANTQVLSAVTPFLPSANVSMQGERFVSQDPASKTASVGSTVVGGQQSQYSSYASLNGNWNLFNGGKDMAGYRGAKAGVLASENDLVKQTNETLSAALIAYNDVFKAQMAVLRQAETAALLRGVLRRTENRYSQGIDNQIALSQERVAFAKNEQGMFQACQALLDKSAIMARSLGLRLPSGQAIRLDAPVPEVRGLDLADADLDMALMDDPGVKAANDRVTMAKHKLEQARASFYPTLAMTGRYDFLGQNPDSFGSALTSTTQNSYRFGLVIQQPLGPFTGEYAAVELAQADLLKAGALHQQALIDAETKLRTVLNNKTQTELSAKSGQLLTGQLRLTFLQTSKLYKDGYADLDAVSRAQISLFKEQEATEELLSDAKLAAWNVYLVLRPDEFATVLLGANPPSRVLEDKIGPH